MIDNIQFKSSKKVYFIVFSTYIYAITNELSISLTSPVLRTLSNLTEYNILNRTISTDEQEWLASSICLGYMAGLIPFCFLCLKYGRKCTLLLAGVTHFIGSALFLKDSLSCYCIGRFICGVASSVGFIILPMYIAEISGDSDRGSLLVSRQIFASLGTLLAFSACIISERILIFGCFGMGLAFVFLLFFSILGEESPYFYSSHGKIKLARKVYKELNAEFVNSLQVKEEVNEIQRTINITEGDTLVAVLKQKHIQKSILVVFALFIFQQLTGYMAFATYAEIIVVSEKATMIIGCVILAGSIFTTFLIDTFGRKFFLLLSATGVVLVHVALLVYYVYFHPSFYPRAVCIALFFLSYNLGLAFIPQIICAEILPQKIKFQVAAFAAVFAWGVAFFITKYYLQVNHIFMIFGFLGCSIAQLVIIKIFVPETKKQSLRMIQGMLQIEANPRDDD